MQVTEIRTEGITDTIFLTATTVYNKKTTIQAPITGYITGVNVSTGNMVSKGNEIFYMETKEHRSLNSSPKERIDSTSYRYLLGKITISSPVYGQIMDLSAQDGAFVQEGTQLCTIVNVADLNLNLFVPAEYGSFISRGTACTILLPSGQSIIGTVTGLLSKTESNSQSETFLVKPHSELIIPEGLNLKVYTVLQKSEGSQLLPKDAVLANETLDKFWVMEVINDSTAVKIPVRTGIVTKESIEIVGPKFNKADKFVTSGSYGLPDTALISIQPDPDEK